MSDALVAEYERIKVDHRRAIRLTLARSELGPSVMRVYRQGTKEPLMRALSALDPDCVPDVPGQEAYRAWFEKSLDAIAAVIAETNEGNSRIFPGYKWGHATKVLCIYVRDLVNYRVYFTDAEAVRISPWLYSPIDGLVIHRLRNLHGTLPFRQIKGIDTPEKFYLVQDLLGQAAAKVGVPRVWFDDNWGDRQ
jgi:hypothetical protein